MYLKHFNGVLLVLISILLISGCGEAADNLKQTVVAEGAAQGKTAVAEGVAQGQTAVAEGVTQGQTAVAKEVAQGQTAVAEKLNPSIPPFQVPVNGVGGEVKIGTYGPGSSTHPCGRVDQYAIDYVLGNQDNKGPAIYPALDGEIVYSGNEKYFGNVIAIRHGDGQIWNKKYYYSIYAHLANGELRSKGPVKKTDIIGYMGKTGDGANGVTHLHFSVRSSENKYEGATALYGQNKKDDGTVTIFTSPYNIRATFGYSSDGC